jgi:hypothetical protein
MSFAASILQVDDVTGAEFFFREVFGFTKVRTISNQMIELHVSAHTHKHTHTHTHNLCRGGYIFLT